MSWYPKNSSKSSKSGKTSRETDVPFVNRLTERLRCRIAAAEKQDKDMIRLQNLIPESKSMPAFADFSIEKAWRTDKRLGRSTSYYALEEEALHADLPRVAAQHNREIILQEIEKRRREIAWETARNFWPLQTLPEEEKLLVMYFAGALPPADGEPKTAPLPTNVVMKYRLIVKNGNRRREYEPDPEIEKLMTETFASEEDIRLASLAEAGMLAAGQRMNICYGSKGD